MPRSMPPLTRHNTRLATGLLLVLSGMAAGCTHQPDARQDIYTTPTASCARMLPTVTGTRTYTPAHHTGTDDLRASPDSAVAYPNPQTPAFCDRPLSETLRASIEMANYSRVLEKAGLLSLLQQNGPFTVFGIPNSALESYAAPQTSGIPDTLVAQARAIGAYSIVPGRWTQARIRAAVLASPSHQAHLPTLDGAGILARLDATTGQIILENGQGVSTRLWVVDVPQSNGILYFTQGLLPPPSARADHS